MGAQSQWERLTCGSVVEVLVDELEGVRVSNGAIVKLVAGEPKHTSLEAFAMSLKAGGGTLGMMLSTLTYSGMMAACLGCNWKNRGVFWGGVVGQAQNFLRGHGKGPR